MLGVSEGPTVGAALGDGKRFFGLTDPSSPAKISITLVPSVLLAFTNLLVLLKILTNGLARASTVTILPSAPFSNTVLRSAFALICTGTPAVISVSLAASSTTTATNPVFPSKVSKVAVCNEIFPTVPSTVMESLGVFSAFGKVILGISASFDTRICASSAIIVNSFPHACSVHISAFIP